MIRFLVDYQGNHSGPHFFRAGQLSNGLLSDAQEAALVAEGRAVLYVEIDPEREEKASEPAVAVNAQPAESVDFTRVKGIGEDAKLALYNAGILTWQDVLDTGAVGIARNVEGVGMARARALFAMAQKEA